jgi:hypothetical protein
MTRLAENAFLAVCLHETVVFLGRTLEGRPLGRMEGGVP